MNPNIKYHKKGAFDSEVWCNMIDVFKKEFLKKTSAKNLDIGCGSGKKADYIFGKNNWYGIDFSEESKAHEIFNLNQYPYKFETQKADNILCFGVLEHLYSPYKTLKEIHRLLNPDGRLFLMVPSVNNRDMIIVPEHFYYFNEKMIRIMLKTIGFNKVRFYYNGPFNNQLLNKIWGKSDIYCITTK